MNHTGLKYGLLLFCTSAFGSLFSMTTPPGIQRACLDKISGVVTVYFSAPTDGCGSFSSYELWGRDNTTNPFVKLASLGSQSASQIQSALPNQKKWEFYIAALYACNGVDTLFSDTLFVDDEPPGYLEPDSVSIDLLTQKMVAGWSKAPEPDVMGYSLFKSNPSNGNNLLIDEKNVLFYSFSVSDFDPTKIGNRFTLAVYDSCYNGGVISNYHSPVLAGFDGAQNADYQCTRKLFLQWTSYVGWPVDGYDIYVKNNLDNNWSIAGSVSGGVNSFVFDIPALGPTYSFFIRAHKTSSAITSSSNLISFATSDFILPSVKTIGHVSVIADGVLEITGFWEPTVSLSAVRLQMRNHGSSVWSNIATYNSDLGKTGRYQDKNRNTSQQKYEYRLLFLNTCDEPVDSCTPHISILLRRNLTLFYWNEYWAWLSSSHITDLTERLKQSSTWNPLAAFPDSQYIVIDTSQANCYRVASVLLDPSNKPLDTAYSNTICLRALDTTLVPSGFTPGGNNPIFKIYNPNLEEGQAVLKIYDRWGGKLFEGDALVGWDGKDRNGDFYISGMYVYHVQVKTIEKNSIFKGTLLLLR